MPKRPDLITLKPTPKHGLARVLSKQGICSRTQATSWIIAGRVSLNGQVQRNPEHPTDLQRARISIDGVAVQAAMRVYIALNKPRSLIVSTADEKGRDTIYSLLADARLPWLAPVGRLDKASEGLLLLSNDPQWAAGITEPSYQLHKTYHVQISSLPDQEVLAAMVRGVSADDEHLAAVSARLLRSGDKNAWLEIVLDEGRNRHIRRLLAALGHDVLRLVRVAIGPVKLGELAKGQWRYLTAHEVQQLGKAAVNK
ncbi:MAG: pseudouridine synthase [Steroidobacteraceae bacterium]